MSNFDKEYIASVLKNARKRANMKQSQLAEMVGISEKHLSKIETGKNYPSLDNFLKMIQILNISYEELGLNIRKTEFRQKEEVVKIINSSSQKEIEAYLDLIITMRKHIV